MLSKKRGFTIIELIVVMAILGLLVMLAVPNFMGHTEQANMTRLLNDARVLEDGCHRYYIAEGDWPRESDTPLTAEELTEVAYAVNGEETVLEPEQHNYYRLDMGALSKYVRINSNPLNFVLQNPEGSVYLLEPGENPALGGEPEGSTGNEPLRQPEAGEIAIYTAEDLDNVRNNLSGSYILMADIDLSGYSEGEGWTPIGDYAANEANLFTGTFDGNGFVIENLTINRPNTDCQGLFGKTDGARITNVALENVDVTGDDYVGGLVGENFNGTITNSYATGSVSGSYYTGGLVGQNYNGTITNSYYDKDTTGLTHSAGGTGLTTEQMKQQASFSGWDFTSTWAIDEGVSYPYLQDNEQVPHPQ